MIALVIIGYIVLAAAIVFLSIKLSDYVDMLDKTTKLSGALLGGVLLAAVTSLPELFTTLTSVIGVGNTDYVLGNILGSDIFDIITLAVLFVIFIGNVIKCRISKSNIWQALCLLGLYAVVIVCVLLPNSIKKYIVLGGWFNIGSFLIIGLYVASLFLMDKTEEKEEAKEEFKLTTKQIVIRFVIAAILLVSASIAITFLSDMIVQEFDIGATAGGALLLGIMTSLPEVISTFNLFFRKNVNAGTGNIIGSCVFNMIIIALSELFSWGGSVFTSNPEVDKLMILGIISIACMLIAILIKLFLFSKREEKRFVITRMSLIIFFSLASFACYILYLIPGFKIF